MKYLLVVAALLLVQSCQKEDAFFGELAFRWAPIHFQDTDDTDAKADFITRFDYDGNYDGTDNWDHLNTGNLSAHAYYSVTETSSHWYILYAFFHPRDWTDHSFDDVHENDLEGVLFIVRRDNSQFGVLDGAITVAHSDFYSFVPDGSPLTNGNEDIDGDLSFQEFEGALHPKTSQEAKGHGLKAWPHIGDFSGDPNEDGIIYFPSNTAAEVPSSGNDRAVSYKLIDLNGVGNLWTLQLFEATTPSSQAKTYNSWGNFKGDGSGNCGEGLTVGCSDNAANSPWGWDDGDDGPNYNGELALDPAAVADYYFNGSTFSPHYTRNRYLENLKSNGYDDNFKPNGWPSQLKFSELYQKL